jgi:hypothetical protein
VSSGLIPALRQAGLIDDRDDWCGGADVALVGCGDYIDRGTDSFGVLTLLERLSKQAQKADSMVVLAQGNHEVMALRAAEGDSDLQEIWLSNVGGGLATMIEGGVDRYLPLLRGDPQSLTMAIYTVLHPILAQLQAMPTAVRWRDVLFVHAGLVPNGKLADMLSGEDHLWQRPRYQHDEDLLWDLTGPAYVHYRAEGIQRVVFGHSPQAAARTFQDGRALCIDTNACAKQPGEFDPQQATLTLARIPAQGSLGDAEFVVIDTLQAPDRKPPA